MAGTPDRHFVVVPVDSHILILGVEDLRVLALLDDQHLFAARRGGVGLDRTIRSHAGCRHQRSGSHDHQKTGPDIHSHRGSIAHNKEQSFPAPL